jgi:hypothetical protein
MKWERFSQGEWWRCQYKGYGYVIGADQDGYHATATKLVAPGIEPKPPEWTATATTWTAAETLCRRHARGRRDA